MKLFRELLAYFLVFALLSMDFFNEWHIWTVIPKTVVIILFIIGMIFSFAPSKKLDLEANFWLQLRVMAVIIIMIIVLPFFGGQSEIGLSLSEPFFIIVILLCLFQLRMQWKRVQQEKAKEEEIKKQQEKLQGKTR
ncbi:MAG: hypothetical protein KBT36_17365 [Kurthia sp.]|nr:hypothetical protein [Candidatus Kurthia equi]